MNNPCNDCPRHKSHLPDNVQIAIATVAGYRPFAVLDLDNVVDQFLCSGCTLCD